MSEYRGETGQVLHHLIYTEDDFGLDLSESKCDGSRFGVMD